MKQVILDTSFVLSCVKQKIDFVEIMEMEGMSILIPEQVIDELMGLGAQLALNILQKSEFKLVKVQGKDGDSALIKYAKANPSVIVATLDEDLKKRLRNHKLVIRGKKKVEII